MDTTAALIAIIVAGVTVGLVISAVIRYEDGLNNDDD